MIKLSYKISNYICIKMKKLKAMGKVEAERSTLIKDFKFEHCFRGPHGVGRLLVPHEGNYKIEIYGLGELKLMLHIQKPFNEGLELRISELKRTIRDDEDQWPLNSESDSEDEEPFLHRTIRKFRGNDLIKDSVNDDDILSKGENYDRTRLLRMSYHHPKDTTRKPLIYKRP